MTELFRFRLAAVSSFPFLTLEYVNDVHLLVHLSANKNNFVVNS